VKPRILGVGMYTTAQWCTRWIGNTCVVQENFLYDTGISKSWKSKLQSWE